MLEHAGRTSTDTDIASGTPSPPHFGEVPEVLKQETTNAAKPGTNGFASHTGEFELSKGPEENIGNP